MTFHQLLLDHAGAHPERTALVSPHVQLSYGELHRLVEGVGAGMSDRGVGPRLVVVSLLPKGIRLVVAALATWRAGGVFAQLETRTARSELSALLGLLDPVLVLGPPDCRDLVRRAGSTAHYLAVHGDGVEWPSLGAHAPMRGTRGDGFVPAYVNFSSGTTGRPKAVLASEHNILANARAASHALGLLPEDVHLCLFPAHLHPHELFARAILLGGSAVLLPSVRPRSVGEAVVRWHVTALMAAPFFYELALRAGRARGLGNVRVAEAGGAVSSVRLRSRLKRAAGVALAPVWGSTETTGVALSAPLGMRACEPGFVGVPCPGYDARLEHTELHLRGEGVALGYVTGRGLVISPWGEWVATGDCFSLTNGGAFRFMGRRSGMIKVAGERVYPAELEAVLSSHPGVAECAVVAVRDTLRGEVPAAAVVASGELDPKDLGRHCREVGGPSLVPRRFVVVQELPRRPGGKPDIERIRSLFDK